MKKLILLISLFGIVLNGYGQRDVWTDTFNIATLGGTDTVIYKYNEDSVGSYKPGFGECWSMEIECKAVSALCSDAIIDIGFSQDMTTFTSFSSVTGGSTVLPYIITGSDSASVNGVYKLSKGSCSSGSLIVKVTQN